MVRHSGVMVVIGLVLAGARHLGDRAAADRLHPERGPGLSDARGAVAGRCRARAHDRRAGRGDQAAPLDTPGVEQVIAHFGHVRARQFRRPGQCGGQLCRAQAVGRAQQGRRHRHSVDRRALQKGARHGCPTAGCSWCRRRRSRASAMPAGCRCSSSCSAAASTTQKLERRRAADVIKRAQADPQLQRVLTTFGPGAPHVTVTVDRARAQTLRVSVGDVFSALSSYLGSTYVNQFNKFGQTFQVYVQADSQFRLRPDDLLNLYVRSQDNQMVPIGAVAHLGLGGRPVARHPLQSLSLRHDHRRAGARRQLGPGDRRDGGDREERHCRTMSATNGPRCPIRRS